MSYWDLLDPFLQQQITDQANRLAHEEKYVGVLLEILMRTMTGGLRIHQLFELIVPSKRKISSNCRKD